MATTQETTGRIPVTECGKTKYYFMCPCCRSDADFLHVNEESTGLGLLFFLAGDLLPALLCENARHRRVQCAQCGYIFRRPAFPRTAVSKLAIWIIAILAAFVFVTSLVIAYPEILDLIPQSPILNEAEKLIADNPKVVLFVLVSTTVVTVLIFALSLFASWVSSYRANAELRKQFETQPKQRDNTSRQTTPVD